MYTLHSKLVVQMWSRGVSGGVVTPPSRYQQTIRKSAPSPPGGVRLVPNDGFHSHRPTNPR